MRRFCLVLLKPSHYDDEGYVIQWVRSAIPSNSLAAMYGLALDCAKRRVLGDDVELEIHAFDEPNVRVKPSRIARLIERADAGLVMLVGVQSNQFPRALDLAAPLRARGIPIIIGGFHVSGVLRVLGGRDAALDRARAMGISLFAGEAEGRLDGILKDAMAGALAPVYDFTDELPDLAGAPIPLITALGASRIAGSVTSFDAGRGCPFQCSFCTIINVQGHESRHRTPDDVERIVRENVAQGLHSFFITDDNFARNAQWEPILDRLIQLRTVERMKLTFILQVDTLCHRIPRFIEKAAAAGVSRVFIGLESINPDNLAGAKKRQNRITEYREMLLAWKDAQVITYAGYITGFPGDTPESIQRDVEIIKKELPVDLLEFFFLTPLPGSEDHATLVNAGTSIDADLNRYDLSHAAMPHPRMSRAEWERAYRTAWKTYYTMEHMETVFRRLVARGRQAGNAVLLMTWFIGSIQFENVHPLESGIVRRKARRDRRPGLPVVPAWRFWPRRVAECARTLAGLAALYVRLYARYRRIERHVQKYGYMDVALMPASAGDVERFEMFQRPAAQAFVMRQREQREAAR